MNKRKKKVVALVLITVMLTATLLSGCGKGGKNDSYVLAAAYTRALLKASAYVQANPEGAAKLQIANNQCSGELADNAKLLASYNYQPSVSAVEETFRNIWI